MNDREDWKISEVKWSQMKIRVSFKRLSREIFERDLNFVTIRKLFYSKVKILPSCSSSLKAIFTSVLSLSAHDKIILEIRLFFVRGARIERRRIARRRRELQEQRSKGGGDGRFEGGEETATLERVPAPQTL